MGDDHHMSALEAYECRFFCYARGQLYLPAALLLHMHEMLC